MPYSLVLDCLICAKPRTALRAGAKEAVAGSIGGEELMEVARRAAEGGGLFVQDGLARPAEPGIHPENSPGANRWLL